MHIHTHTHSHIMLLCMHTISAYIMLFQFSILRAEESALDCTTKIKIDKLGLRKSLIFLGCLQKQIYFLQIKMNPN